MIDHNIDPTEQQSKKECIDCIDCPRCKERRARCTKLSTFDWISDLAPHLQQQEFVEVQFKNTRKEICRNPEGLKLHRGDYVVIEADNGHDVGIVILTGDLVRTKMRTNSSDQQVDQIRCIYRLATEIDMQRYREAKALEHSTMIRAREISAMLGLEMKIGDVEFQGDGKRAIFYYIADQRVDFRQLIRLLADAFHVRIEMRQIGARQEAGRIGGIGPCGRPLCCSSWMGRFSSVSTAAARFQDLPLNPLKLTGQCSKLKCCTNFEVNTYIEAKNALPSLRIPLETEQGTYYYFKYDLLAGMITYSLDPSAPSELETISFDRAKEILDLNKRGVKPDTLSDEEQVVETKSKDILFDNAINRFDQPKEKRKKKKNRKKRDLPDKATSRESAPRPIDRSKILPPSEAQQNQDRRLQTGKPLGQESEQKNRLNKNRSKKRREKDERAGNKSNSSSPTPSSTPPPSPTE